MLYCAFKPLNTTCKIYNSNVKAETKSENVLTESKEVTGNKTETANADDEGNIIEIKRLAGLN